MSELHPSSEPARERKQGTPASDKRRGKNGGRAQADKGKPLARQGPRKLDPRTVYTDEIGERIIKYLAQGNYLQTAAAAAGMNPGTVRGWIERGQDDENSPYHEFAMRCLEASGKIETQVVSDMMRVIEETKQWAGYMTYLERRFPDRWKRQGDKAQINVNIGILEKRVHEITATAEETYDGG